MTVAEKKRMHIIKSARKVFIKKGYKNVTMSDLVEAAEISRGNLYMYFENTRDVFFEVLKEEIKEEDNYYKSSFQKSISAKEILDASLDDIMGSYISKETPVIAVYEFLFDAKETVDEKFIKEHYKRTFKLISDTLTYGIKRGEFNELDVDTSAKTIVFLLEGMRISSAITDLDKEVIEKQMNMIKRLIYKESI